MDSFIYYGLVYFVEALIIWQYSTQMFSSKYPKLVQLCLSIALYIIPFLLSFTENVWINFLSFFIISFIYLLVTFHCTWYVALFHTSIITAIMSSTELLSSAIFSHLTYAFYQDSIIHQNLSVLAVVSKLLYHLSLQVIVVLFANNSAERFAFAFESIILIFLPVLTTFIMITFTLIDFTTTISDTLNLLIGVSSFLLLISNIVIFAVHNYTQEKNAKFTEMQLQLQKEYDLTEYYKLLIEQHENQSILIHDIKKHLNSISLLNQQNETEKIDLYINQIIHSSDLQTSLHISDNDILNAILSRYMQKCRTQRIDFRIDIRKQSVNFLEVNDLTSLICNLLDNAFESASLQENSYIELHISRKENTPFTLLTLTNSCRTNPFSEDGKKLITRKQNKLRHGYGIKSITRIVEKYHGDIQMYYDEESNSFHTVLTLKNLSA